MENIPAGDYTVRVTAEGMYLDEQKVSISGRAAVVLDFVLKPYTSDLSEVNIYDSKRNKFAVKQSDAVAKMPLSKLEDPQSYTVIPKELLQEQQVFNVEDGLRNVAGIQKLWDATGRAGSGAGLFSLRGFSTSIRLRNGIVGNVASGMDAANLERVEVIKGPSATLFGSALTSYGGLINRVTKKPYDAFGGTVSYTAGSFGMNRVALDANAPLNQEKSVLLRLNSAYQSAQDFRDNGFNKSFSFAPSLSYIANERLDFHVDAEIFSGKGTGFSEFYLYPVPEALYGMNSADQLSINPKSSYKNNSLVNNTQTLNLFGQMNLKLNDQWKLQTNVSLNSSSSNGRMTYFYLMPNAMIPESGQATGADYLARMVWTPVTSDRGFEIQPNLTGDFRIAGLRNRLTIGLDYYSYQNNTNYERFGNSFTSTAGVIPLGDLFDIIPLKGTSPRYNEFNEGRVAALYASQPTAPYYTKTNTNTYSAYAVDVLNITDQLLAMASLRIDRFVSRPLYDAVSDTRTTGYNQTSLSPKFGLVYQIIDKQLALFGNYQNGFANYQGKDAYGNDFKAEQANQAEGGIKTDLFDGRLTATVSYYHIRVKDIIRTSPEPINGVPNARVQDGTQRSKGFESELIVNPLEGLNIIAGFAYNDSKMLNVRKDIDGRRPTTAGPAKLANAYMSYKIPYGKLHGLGLGIGGNYGSESAVVNSESRGKFVLPSYVVFNTSVFYELPKFRFSFGVNNLTDEKYWIGYVSLVPQAPRNVLGTATFKF